MERYKTGRDCIIIIPEKTYSTTISTIKKMNKNKKEIGKVCTKEDLELRKPKFVYNTIQLVFKS